MADIKIIRLLGVADDIICKIVKCGGKFQIINPLGIRAIPVEKEKSELITPESDNPKIDFRLVLAPFHMPYMRLDKPLECDKCQVVFEIEPTDQVIEKYNSIFSPIIQPKFVAKEIEA
jgi:hypothetical protein